MAALTLQEEGIFCEKVKQYLVLFDRACTRPSPPPPAWGGEGGLKISEKSLLAGEEGS